MKDELRHEVVNGLLNVKGILACAFKCTVGDSRGRFLSDREVEAVERQMMRAISALDRYLAHGPLRPGPEPFSIKGSRDTSD